MLIENNTLKRIYPGDIIDGVFIAPDNVLYVVDHFECDDVNKIILPSVIEIGEGFLYNNRFLKYLEIPKVEKIGKDFLVCNRELENLYIPNIKVIGEWFLFSNTKFNYTLEIVRALSSFMIVGGKMVDKKEYLRKFNLKKLLC